MAGHISSSSRKVANATRAPQRPTKGCTEASSRSSSGRERRRQGKQTMLDTIQALRAQVAMLDEQLDFHRMVINELAKSSVSTTQRQPVAAEIFDLYATEVRHAAMQTVDDDSSTSPSHDAPPSYPSRPPSPYLAPLSFSSSSPSQLVYHPEHHPRTVVMGEGPPTGPPPMASRRCDAFGILHMPTPPPCDTDSLARHVPLPTTLASDIAPTTPPRDTDSLTQPTPPPTALARVTSPTTSTATPALHHSSTFLSSPSILAPTSPTSFPAFLPISTTHTDTDSILHDNDLHGPPHTALAQGLTTHKRDDGTTTQHHTPRAQPLHTTHTSPTDTHSTDDSSLCCSSSSPFLPQRLPAWTSFPSATGLSDSPTPPPTSSPTHPILYIPDANVHLVPQTWVSQRLHRALALLTTSSFLTGLYVSASLRPRPSFSHTAATPARPSADTPAGVTNTPSLTSLSTTPSSFSSSRLQDVKLVSSSPHSHLPSCTSQSVIPTARPAATPAALPAHNQPRGDGDVLRYDYSDTTASHEARFTERGPPVTANIFGAGNDSAGSMSYSQQFGPLDDTDLFLQRINRHCDDLLEQVPFGDSYAGSFAADDDDDDAGDYLAATAACGPPHAQQCGPLPQTFTFNPGAEAFEPGCTELPPPATSDSVVVSIAGALAHDEADAVLAALVVPACDSETQASTACSPSIGQDSVPSCSRPPWFMPHLGQECSASQSEDVQVQEMHGKCAPEQLPDVTADPTHGSRVLGVGQGITYKHLDLTGFAHCWSSRDPMMAHLLRCLHHLGSGSVCSEARILHNIFLDTLQGSKSEDELNVNIRDLLQRYSGKLEQLLQRATAEGHLVDLS